MRTREMLRECEGRFKPIAKLNGEKKKLERYVAIVRALGLTRQKSWAVLADGEKVSEKLVR